MLLLLCFLDTVFHVPVKKAVRSFIVAVLTWIDEEDGDGAHQGKKNVMADS